MKKMNKNFAGFAAIMILSGFFSVFYAQETTTKILAEPVLSKEDAPPSPPKPMETPPPPRSPKSAIIPTVKEKKLPNGLTVAVVERKNVPLVTVQLLVKSGAGMEDASKAGLANLTASLLTKGTKTRTATQIAEEMEFLGGSINAGAGWNSSFITVGVMSDKLDQALAIMADVALNPAFAQEEIDLERSQALDGLTYNLKQPSFLANYVASKYSFDEHPAGGTPESLNAITREDIVDYFKMNFKPDNAVLIFTGDITAIRANSLAQKFFGKRRTQTEVRKEIIQNLEETPVEESASQPTETTQLSRRFLVVDLPNSGQAAVGYFTTTYAGRLLFDETKNREIANKEFFSASVLN